MLDFSKVRLKPFKHQTEDAEILVNSPYLFITSEMRTGKTKIVIDGFQFLWEMGKIDRVIVVAPNPVRGVWADRDFGELQKHLWDTTSARITEYHSSSRTWFWGPKSDLPLEIVVTNFEFLRSAVRMVPLIALCTDKTLIVGDESSFLKNYKAKQTEAFYTMRWHCGRVVLLNGTPITQSPEDLFSQGNILHPGILHCKYITHYRAKYAKMGAVLGAGGKALKNKWGKTIEEVQEWVNLDDLQKRFAPYVIRRLQKDCLDLPPKLDPVPLIAELTPKTWAIYKQMRDECIVMFEGLKKASMSMQASIKVLRLAQITGGFLGGIGDFEIPEMDMGEKPEWMKDGNTINLPGSFLDGLELKPEGLEALQEQEEWAQQVNIASTQEIGREKLDILLWFLEKQLYDDPNFRTVAWVRFRAELSRMLKEVSEKFPQFRMGAIHGGQKRDERAATMALLHPDTTPPTGPIFVGGTYGTGSFGLNFTAANTSINVSFDYSLGKYLQSRDRVYGPGQTKPVAYFDILAVGPKGQKTIDHVILKARKESEEIANWTTEKWVKALKEE